jgi:23S rRNA (cytosine1962-C5)-methyltransferase
VCHLDASKGMVARARENAALNGLSVAPIRWIIDDVTKFLNRELRRGVKYDAVILDPPSFGRGKSGEVFKIEAHLANTLNLCIKLLSPNPLFVLLSCHTPAFTPTVLAHILHQGMKGINGKIESGEMTLGSKAGVFPIPNGTYASWKTND